MAEYDYDYDEAEETEKISDDNTPIITEDFVASMKKERRIAWIKVILSVVIPVAAYIIFREIILLFLFGAVGFFIIRAAFRTGSKYKYLEWSDTFSAWVETDLSFLGFLIGIAIFGGLLSFLNKFDAMLFPHYFFILEFIILGAFAIWLFRPAVGAVFTIRDTSVMLKDPPKAPVFRPCEYDVYIRLQKKKEKEYVYIIWALLGIFVLVIIAQIIQFFVVSPSVLEELDREACYNEYIEFQKSEEEAYIEIPSDIFSDPANEDLSRFRSICTSEFEFETSKDGLVCDNTVKVKYVYTERFGWEVEESEFSTKLVSMDMSGTWSGKGIDSIGLDASEENTITVKVTQMTESVVSGYFYCSNSKAELVYQSSFTGTVQKEELEEDNDDESDSSLIYIVEAALAEPRGTMFYDYDTLTFKYNATNDTMIFYNEYEANLTRQ